MRSSQPQPATSSLGRRMGLNTAPSGLAVLAMATMALGSACSTESGGRKTPITGSPVPTSPRPSNPTTGADSTVKTNPLATTGLQNGGTSTLPVASPTANQAVVEASPTVAPDVAPSPAMDAVAGTAGTSVTSGTAGTTTGASATTTQTATTTTTMAQTTAPAADCTAGKTLTGPRYTKDYLNLRSGPSLSAPQIDEVPKHAEVSYYWTSGTYACVVWRGPTTRVGWLSTAYLQTARP
ncbi:MAG: SH3 domain-containing protein [Silvanigrellales bacterium]|nr:SH3 domain-containing protein [Silvanigrellales bacterium]